MRLDTKRSVQTLLAALSSVVALTAGASVQTQDETDFGQMTYGGNGCSTGVEQHYNKRTGRMVVIFPDMAVGAQGSALDRKSCNIALPVHLAPGKAVVLGNPALFGDTELTGAAKLQLNAESFFVGERGPALKSELASSTAKKNGFYARENSVVTSACGADTIVRLNSNVLLRKGSASEIASATVEGAAFTLRIIDCHE